MQVKNIVRKAVVLGSAVGFVGMTMAGALAYDLSTYPAKFIVDGKFDGKIVVGERASTSDVVGSIDIAASLQGASVSKVAIPGQAGSTSFSGDSFAVKTGADSVELREPIGDVVDTITESDLLGLKGGRITTSRGTTDYHQYLRLKDGTNLQNISVNVVENDDDVMADYMVVDTEAPFLEWEVQFPEGLESDVDDNDLLEDIEDRSFNIMGTDFNIVRATLVGDDLEMTLMGGSVPDTLREQETKTYTINGVDYEVTLVFVSDPSSGSSDPEVKFSVNGEITQALSAGETDTLSGGLQIGVRDVLVNAREGVASFYLGAQKVVFTDNTATESVLFDGDVEINNENINDGEVQILGQNTSTTKFKITSIKYRLTMDAEDGTTAYIPKGKGVKEFMKRPESMISSSLDLKYGGLTAPTTKPVKIETAGDDRYEMTFTNTEGVTYTFPLLSNKDGTWKFGDEDDDLVFVEATAKSVYNIGTDDYFILSNDRGAGDADKSVTNVLRYTDYDNSDFTVEFEDQGTKNSIDVPIATDGTGNLVVGGHTYQVNVSNRSSTTPSLFVDLNADGAAGDIVSITSWGGLVINPLANATNTTDVSMISSSDSAATLSAFIGSGTDLEPANDGSAQAVRMTGTILAKNFDTSDGGNEQFAWTISEVATGNEVDLSFSSSDYSGPLEASGSEVTEFQFRELDSDDDHSIGTSDFGIAIDEYDPSSGNDPNELTFNVPQQQVFGQVFLTLGVSEVVEGSSSGSADKVNPIAVGLAVLDRDAPSMGSENMIIVGGPCANTVAAAFMGNPANCAEGFEMGKAMISSKETSGHVAILVAGYDAQDTVGATRVLAAYKDYNLKGSEVEVVVADLNSIKVQAPTTMTS